MLSVLFKYQGTLNCFTLIDSYPTLNVPIPEEVLEDPRLVFHLDPIISEKSVFHYIIGGDSQSTSQDLFHSL